MKGMVELLREHFSNTSQTNDWQELKGGTKRPILRPISSSLLTQSSSISGKSSQLSALSQLWSEM